MNNQFVYINPNKFIQFELWKDCSIGCKFCCNKGQPKTDKVKSLNRILEILDTDISEYNEIGVIGGELFNGEMRDPEVLSLFYTLLDKINALKFSKVYLATSLIYNANDYLIPVLDYLKKLDIINNVWICTSFDPEYRFKTPKHLQLWVNNMLMLNEKYPEVQLHTETIITQHFVDLVLNHNFDIKDFCKRYHTQLDFIEPSSGLFYKDKKDCQSHCPGFFPTKESFIKFIIKIAPIVNLETMLSMELRSNSLYYYHDNEFKLASNRRNTDGRCLLNGDKKYEIGLIDSDITMRDIILEVLDTYER